MGSLGKRGDVGDDVEKIRQEIWDRAFYASATAFAFEYRAELLKKRLRILNFVALAVPVIIGALASAYGVGFRFLPMVIAVGAAIGLAQIVLSLWSLVAAWVENYGYSLSSVIDNQKIARDFEALAKLEAVSVQEIRHKVDLLKAVDDARQAQDYSQGLTDEEKRRGHRAALRKRGRACAGCRSVPVSMESSDCGVCGKFSERRF